MKEDNQIRSLGNCKYCNEEIFGKHYNKLQAHQRFCICNPDRDKAVAARKRGAQTMNRKVCARNHEAKLANLATKAPRKMICKSCGEEYFLELTDREYAKVLNDLENHPFKKCCSSACAHRHILTLEQKKHRRNSKSICSSVEKQYKRLVQLEFKFTYPIKCKCKVCGKDYLFIPKHQRTKDEKYSKFPTQTFCSYECRCKNPGWINAGKHSAAIQSEIRRSKNEMLFCSLCEQTFEHVEHNKPVFNGWDADVIIHDIHCAVLWNGKWHYEPIMKKGNTLKSIQNRDKIKTKIILELGWHLYVVKDLGKYNKQFVQEEFQKFLKYIKEQQW